MWVYISEYDGIDGYVRTHVGVKLSQRKNICGCNPYVFLTIAHIATDLRDVAPSEFMLVKTQPTLRFTEFVINHQSFINSHNHYLVTTSH